MPQLNAIIYMYMCVCVLYFCRYVSDHPVTRTRLEATKTRVHEMYQPILASQICNPGPGGQEAIGRV